MENAADALKMAFGILVFVIAITMLFTMVSRAKTTADDVFYASDNTNFRDYDYSARNNRQVGISEVIATLYRYYNESVAVTVKLKDNKAYNFDLGHEDILIKDENEKKLLRLSTTGDVEKNLGEFISSCIIDVLAPDTKFTEEFVEVPISGIYVTGEDGSEITLSSGGKKVYITYTQE